MNNLFSFLMGSGLVMDISVSKAKRAAEQARLEQIAQWRDYQLRVRNQLLSELADQKHQQSPSEDIFAAYHRWIELATSAQLHDVVQHIQKLQGESASFVKKQIGREISDLQIQCSQGKITLTDVQKRVEGWIRLANHCKLDELSETLTRLYNASK